MYINIVRDRTAQLSALTQLLLDPYYRTVDGLNILINREFCAFGHMFEERVFKSSKKESSPVYMQFLDALWQLTQQFPTAFEFSGYMLLLLGQSAYSGMYVSIDLVMWMYVCIVLHMYLLTFDI